MKTKMWNRICLPALYLLLGLFAAKDPFIGFLFGISQAITLLLGYILGGGSLSEGITLCLLASLGYSIGHGTGVWVEYDALAGLTSGLLFAGVSILAGILFHGVNIITKAISK